jgi:hypothetical protein
MHLVISLLMQPEDVLGLQGNSQKWTCGSIQLPVRASDGTIFVDLSQCCTWSALAAHVIRDPVDSARFLTESISFSAVFCNVSHDISNLNIVLPLCDQIYLHVVIDASHDDPVFVCTLFSRLPV